MSDASLVLCLSGRSFRAATVTSVDQDAYVMKRMRAFGLLEMAQSFDPATEDMNALGERMLLAAFESGTLYEILGGTLVEEGIKWSRDVAAANAAFFRDLTDPADKQVIFNRLAGILLDFLLVADAWSKGSQKSSTVGNTPSRPATPASPMATEATPTTTMESGIASSGT